MQLSIDGEGHLSYVELTDEQVKFLQELLDEDLATLATAARWAIEQSRQAWQGEQDGPGNGT